ncbi:MAG: hypothetical protein HY704_04030 [Gemmatimonadetes bacterium]|nr:hypothetical protein [Gemmatimonadota bacterium]
MNAEMHGTIAWAQTHISDERSEAGWMGRQPWVEGGAEILRVVVGRHGLAAREAVDAYGPQLAERLEAALESSRHPATG